MPGCLSLCRFVYAGSDSPGPGKYHPRYGAQDRDTHTPDISKMPGFSSIDAKAEAAAARRDATGGQRSPSQGTTQNHGSIPEGETQDAIARQRTDAATAKRAAATAASPAPASNGGLNSDGTTIAGPHPVDPMFADAHRIRPKTPPKPGSAAFKAMARPSPCMETTAGHLAGAYWHEEIDR